MPSATEACEYCTVSVAIMHLRKLIAYLLLHPMAPGPVALLLHV
jgi:hypothetical protein